MTSYGMCELADGNIRNLTQNEKRDVRNVPEGARLFNRIGLASSGVSSTSRSDTFYLHPNGIPCETHDESWDTHICTSACDEAHGTCPLGKQCGQSCTARTFRCPAGNHWRVSLRGMHQLAILGRLTTSSSDTVRWKQYEDEIPGRTVNAIWLDTPATSDKQYVVETPPKVLERCILMTTDPGDLILDLTCGSGAMPFQAETWGRRWVSVDVAQVSIAIARERLITNTYPYHMLKDSPEGARCDHDMEQALLPPDQCLPYVEQPEEDYRHDPQHGFVVERQTRVSAATLAYGHDDQRPINHEDRTVKVTERARVASPVTVESDSPYRSVMPGDTEQDQQATDVETMLQTSGFEVRTSQEDPVTQRITDSLEVAGIGQLGQGRYRVENLAASDIPDVTHTGILVDPSGERHPAFFYIGRADEVISAVQTRNAVAAITVADPSCRHLVMVGFGRDGDAHSVARYRPNMVILQVAANRDLQLPWLKEEKTDSAFTVISEPEVRLHQLDDGTVQLEVIGLNCFDPQKGVVEASDFRMLMGIMVDTEYDTESFRARLVNVREVTRNQKTLKNLRAALRGAIDSGKWEQMLSNKTIPFELPEPGVKIAVKVIDQNGMEHMSIIDDPHRLLAEL